MQIKKKYTYILKFAPSPHTGGRGNKRERKMVEIIGKLAKNNHKKLGGKSFPKREV